jgi:hypothetical protein
MMFDILIILTIYDGVFPLVGVYSLFLCQGCAYLPLQFPLLTSPQTGLITRSAWVFLQNSATVGFSFVLARCRWHPKNCSSGSCEIFSLRNTGIVKTNLVSSVKDLGKNKRLLIATTVYHTSNLYPQEGLLTEEHIFLLFGVNPCLMRTLSSHSFK